jgi:hypothetical protein
MCSTPRHRRLPLLRLLSSTRRIRCGGPLRGTRNRGSTPPSALSLRLTPLLTSSSSPRPPCPRGQIYQAGPRTCVLSWCLRALVFTSPIPIPRPEIRVHPCPSVVLNSSPPSSWRLPRPERVEGGVLAPPSFVIRTSDFIRHSGPPQACSPWRARFALVRRGDRGELRHSSFPLGRLFCWNRLLPSRPPCYPGTKASGDAARRPVANRPAPASASSQVLFENRTHPIGPYFPDCRPKTRLDVGNRKLSCAKRTHAQNP